MAAGKRYRHRHRQWLERILFRPALSALHHHDIVKPPKSLSLSLVVVLNTASLTAQHLPPVPSVIARIQFESHRRSYIVEMIPGERAEVREVFGPSCMNNDMSPELEGDYALVLKLGSKEISRQAVKFGQFVSYKDRWLALDDESQPVLEVLQRPAKEPLIRVRQYGSCNGNFYSFYWIDSQRERPVLKPVTFIGDHRLATGLKVANQESASNQLYASSGPGDMRLLPQAGAKDSLEIHGYYIPDGFWYVDLFVEDAPGVWRFVEEMRK